MPVLDYGRPPSKLKAPVTWRQIVPALVGIVAGYLIDQSGFGFACVGLFAGFVLGIISAICCPKRPFFHATVGGSIAIITSLIIIFVQNELERTSPSFTLHEVCLIAIVFTAIILVPALIGAGFCAGLMIASDPNKPR